MHSIRPDSALHHIRQCMVSDQTVHSIRSDSVWHQIRQCMVSGPKVHAWYQARQCIASDQTVLSIWPRFFTVKKAVEPRFKSGSAWHHFHLSLHLKRNTRGVIFTIIFVSKIAYLQRSNCLDYKSTVYVRMCISRFFYITVRLIMCW
jgi:hypothetical protein